MLTTKVPVRDRSGEIVGTMGIAQDITYRKATETHLSDLALHDALTGLPNRTLLEDRMSQAFAFAKRNPKRVGIMALDLDRFRIVNEAYGHHVGDALLRAVSKRLSSCLKDGDTLARLCGDDFIVCVPALNKDDDFEKLAQKLLEMFTEPYLVDGHELQLSASIGLCQYPVDSENAVTLLQFAESALREAQRRGRGTWCVFQSGFSRVENRQHRLECDLERACARDEFVLQYQPIVAASSGRIKGVEALLRWRHPEFGTISPAQFIPQLEEMGLMAEVGRWVLKAACRQAATWRQHGIPPIRIAVNVSPKQFYYGNIAETVASVLKETGLDSKWLELELTESQMLDDSAATRQIMQNLKRLGVGLVLDDFGTGWSSLSYLRQFAIDRIKVDQSFIRDVVTQPAAAAVVKTILDLSKSLGLACIAEGVETTQQRDFLQKEKCEEMQGFLFSRPLTAADCTALLRSQGSAAMEAGYPRGEFASLAC